MIRRYSHIRSRALKYTSGIIGDEYKFTFQGEDYSLSGRFIEDQQSPDLLRWIATRESNAVIRSIVYEIADGKCEMHRLGNCWKWAPVDRGHPHHLIHKKMGGAYTDDRIWVCGKRIRIWACPTCHSDHHGNPQWSFKKVRVGE
jgi:hypothetical protein